MSDRAVGEMIRIYNVRRYEEEYIKYKFGKKWILVDGEARVVFGTASSISQIKCVSGFNYTRVRN